MSIRTRVAQLDNGRWVIEYASRWEDDWGSFEDQETYATKAEAVSEMRFQQIQNSNEARAESLYQSQVAYACGERD